MKEIGTDKAAPLAARRREERKSGRERAYHGGLARGRTRAGWAG
jgi:hypothetical protein